MLIYDTPPGRIERALARIPDGTILRGVAVALLVSAVALLGADFIELSQRADGALPGTTRVDPLPMVRPSPGDQVRPYLPRTRPLGPGRGTPELPGYRGPLDGTVLSERMAFFADDAGNVTAIGRIDPGTSEEFARYLDERAEPVKALYLHSPGGSVRDAIVMGEAIRAREITTVVPAHGYCASACPLVFAGGSTRQAPDGAWVGVHQVYGEGSAVGGHSAGMADAQEISATCQQHLADMGVATEVWIKAMQTPPDQLYVLTQEELAEYDMVTEG